MFLFFFKLCIFIINIYRIFISQENWYKFYINIYRIVYPDIHMHLV